MSTTSIGRQAEQLAAKYLEERHDLSLIASNWRTRTCEIDLIMQNPTGTEVHFIEVKFRRSNFAGGGIQSISKQKLQRMHSASLEWLQANSNYQDTQPILGAIELTGKTPKVTNYIPSIEL